MRDKNIQLSIIIPTYKEAQNISSLLERITNSVQSLFSYEVIIVDDDSCDGTDDIVKQLEKNFPVKLFIRKNERGLSSAVLYGISRSAGEILLVMDADHSHPPEKIPNLVNPILSGEADFCVGSRYVQDSAIKDWTFLRRFVSWIATRSTRPLLKLNDPMSGFFCLRKVSFEAIKNMNPIGYKICLELLVKGSFTKVIETPITFENRREGKSKLNMKEIIHFLFHLFALYRYKFLTRK